jgi:hypothetical protein
VILSDFVESSRETGHRNIDANDPEQRFALETCRGMRREAYRQAGGIPR